MSLLESTKAELARSGAPVPQDFVEDWSPHAGLFYGWQTARALLTVVEGASIQETDDPDIDPAIYEEVINGVAQAVAGFTHALVALDVLPAEAEQAISGAATAEVDMAEMHGGQVSNSAEHVT